jgi:hypothetical protein
MFEVLGKLRGGVCSEIVNADDRVILDLMYAIIHQECYPKTTTPQFTIKDEGTFRKMLFIYPFFQ